MIYFLFCFLLLLLLFLLNLLFFLLVSWFVCVCLVRLWRLRLFFFSFRRMFLVIELFGYNFFIILIMFVLVRDFLFILINISLLRKKFEIFWIFFLWIENNFFILLFLYLGLKVLEMFVISCLKDWIFFLLRRIFILFRGLCLFLIIVIIFGLSGMLLVFGR